MASPDSIIAVDVGNSRLKLGRFDAVSPSDGLPQPTATIDVDLAGGSADDFLAAATWCAQDRGATVWIASVNRPAAKRLGTSLATVGMATRELTHADLPIVVRLDEPRSVGMDRLLGAVAANALRRSDHAAIIVSVGTAITVNLVGKDGAFLGGAIAPGIALSARAFHEHTDLLPLIPMSDLAAAPPALGTTTVEAMRSGLFWGAVGGIRTLIEHLQRAADAEVEVFLTGGAAPSVAPLLHPSTRHEPHLVLAGIALSAAASQSGRIEGGSL